jgi:hypothetical protein
MINHCCHGATNRWFNISQILHENIPPGYATAQADSRWFSTVAA